MDLIDDDFEEQTLNETLKTLKKTLEGENKLESNLSIGDNIDLVELKKKINQSMEINVDCCKCKLCGKVTTGRNRKQQTSH